MSIKLLIKIDSSRPPSPAPKPECKPALKEKIEYAIECIELEHRNASAALDFLRKTYTALQKLPKYRDKHAALCERIVPLLNVYGYDQSDYTNA